MTDTREVILARLLVILGTIEGVAGSGATKAVGRNIDDVPAGWSDRRPAILLQDAVEEFFDAPPLDRRSAVQRMALRPVLTILAGADAKDVGALLNLFRARLIAAVLSDADLRTLVGTNGRVHYAGCERLPAGPESKEGRMEVTFVFTYVLRLTDLS